MLTAQILNPNATLNSYKVINTLDFVAGNQAKLVLQLWDDQENLRFVPPSTAIVTATFNLADGTTLDKQATLLTDDRSMCTILLSATDTAQLLGGNVLIKADLAGDGTQIFAGLIFAALSQLTIDS